MPERYAPNDGDGIVLDENYLHALREAAYDWGIESLDAEQVVSRRAAIWFGRNIVVLVDEVHSLRKQLGEKA